LGVIKITSLYELTFNQESLGELLERLNISGNIEIMPWSIGNALVEDGQITGYMVENQAGGLDFLDVSTNHLGTVQPGPGESFDLWGQLMEHLGSFHSTPELGISFIDMFQSSGSEVILDSLTNVNLDFPAVPTVDFLSSIIDFI
jgi:hypothetical protein